jgi:hypothetical protein
MGIHSPWVSWYHEKRNSTYLEMLVDISSIKTFKSYFNRLRSRIVTYLWRFKKNIVFFLKVKTKWYNITFTFNKHKNEKLLLFILKIEEE